MAKIIIKLNTREDPEDVLILRAVANVVGNFGEPEGAPLPTEYVQQTPDAYAINQPSPEVEPTAKRTRRTKAEMAADTATETAPTEEAAQQETDEGAVTLSELNLVLTELMGPKHGVTAMTLKALVEANTDGTASSPKFADPMYYPAIMAALRDLQA